jgi:hypothetical protein
LPDGKRLPGLYAGAKMHGTSHQDWSRPMGIHEHDEDLDKDLDMGTMMDGGPMGQVLRDMMGSKFETLLFNALYEIDDIEGSTVWGASGQPEWNKKMQVTRTHIVDQLGDDGMTRYGAFHKEHEKEIYG